MSQDDIIKLAREAASKHGHTLRDVPQPETIEFLLAFRGMAVAAEREACAKLAEMRKEQSRNHLVRSGLAVLELDIRARSTT